MGAVLALLAVGFVALLRHAEQDALRRAAAGGYDAGEGGRWRIAPLLSAWACWSYLGLTLPTPLEALLNQIVKVVANDRLLPTTIRAG